MFDSIQYRILKLISPRQPDSTASVHENKSKLRALMGDGLFNIIAGKVVVDFGCGEGDEAIEIAKGGALRVIGIDIREEVLQKARQKAAAVGLHDICSFGSSAPESADVALSIDAFEHFEKPDEVLQITYALLKPGGQLCISFGPPWCHPSGGHLFSVFPWAHFLFSERALIRWRSDFKTDGATRFSEVAGGLNRMTIGRFERLLKESPFEVSSLELVPIRKLRRFHNRFTREFFTAIVRCQMVKGQATQESRST